MFFAGLSKQLVEITKKKLPQASVTDFLSCGSFNRPPRSLVSSFSFFVEIATARHDC